MNDIFYMKKALAFAKKGKGKVEPNPMVGAIIVKNGEIISEGWHQKYGLAHAEVNAINKASQNLENSTMYVNLEPCSHYGKTPPCADLIIQNKIKKVVIAMVDPNEKVSGKGIAKLENAGIGVVCGVLEKEAKQLNEVFIKNITKNLPFVTLKSAMSLDGKIACENGNSQWISNEKSRAYVHKLRNENSAIMVGINTVLSDDPSLTCRIKNGRNPIRVVVDSLGKIPLESKIVKTANEIKTILACCDGIETKKEKILQENGLIIVKTSRKNGKVDLKVLLQKLYEMGIYSILMEGGATLSHSLLKENLIDKFLFFVCPLIIGGQNSPTPITGESAIDIPYAYKLENLSYKKFADDLLITAYPKGCEKCSPE